MLLFKTSKFYILDITINFINFKFLKNFKYIFILEVKSLSAYLLHLN